MNQPRFHWRSVVLVLLLVQIAIQDSGAVIHPATSALSEPAAINGILRPRIGYPAFITQEDSFEAKVTLPSGADTWKAAILNELANFELTVKSEVKNLRDNTLTLKLRAQKVPLGLYSLELTALASEGTVVARYREPNSVSVRASLQFPLRIMWITDTHIDDGPAQSLNFRRIVRLANFLRPDLIVHTGDVVNFARESYFDVAVKLMQDLEVPIILAPGNHDHAIEGEFFSKYLAPWYGSLNIGPLHIATLDTGPGSIVGELPDAELAWLSNDLAVNEQSKIKILMWHHPMFDVDNPRNETVQAVYGIAARYGVNLIINGHMHADIIFHGPVLTLINPNAYEGGRPYTGFRMLTISGAGIDYRYAGEEQSIPLYDFDVNYSQPNDGKSFGIVVELANRWKMTVNGVLNVRVAHGEFLRVDGAAVSSVTNRTDYALIAMGITVEPVETRRIVAYTKTDNQPPVIELEGAPKIVEGPSVIIAEFRWRIVDSVLGVKNAEMYYSTDNKTWTSLPLVQVEPRIFWARTQLDKSTVTIFLYAQASDVQGRGSLSSTIWISLSPGSTESATQTTSAPDMGFALIPIPLLATVGIAAALGYLFLKRKAKQNRQLTP